MALSPPGLTTLPASLTIVSGSCTWLTSVCATTASKLLSGILRSRVSPERNSTRLPNPSSFARRVAASTKYGPRSLPVTLLEKFARRAIVRAATPVPQPISSTVFAESTPIASRYSRNTFWKNQCFPRSSSRETMTSRSTSSSSSVMRKGSDAPPKYAPHGNCLQVRRSVSITSRMKESYRCAQQASSDAPWLDSSGSRITRRSLTDDGRWGGCGPARTPGGFGGRADEVLANGGAGAPAGGAGSRFPAGASRDERGRAWVRAEDGGAPDRLHSRRLAQPLSRALEQAERLRAALAGRTPGRGGALRVLGARGLLHPDRGLWSVPAIHARGWGEGSCLVFGSP